MVIALGHNLLQSNVSLSAIIISALCLIGYGISFFVPMDYLTMTLPISVLAASITTFFMSMHFHFRQLFIYGYTLAWGIRLLVHLIRRAVADKSDRRLDPVRNNFLLRGLTFLGMILLAFSFTLPTAMVSAIKPSFLQGWTVRDILGIVFWVAGFVMEIVADVHLFSFRHKSENAGKICRSGLWAHHRHPNYIGEVLQWWGVFLLSTPAILGVEWLLVIAPVFSTICLLFISGIPPAEWSLKKEFGNTAEYEDYKADSGMYIPWFKSKKNAPVTPSQQTRSSEVTDRQNKLQQRNRLAEGESSAAVGI
ncbi:putative 3-oxo-5-alpha-steroid 4-dehydrogenase 1 [Blattamonas nauphoetae]|uniref:3-oxo-5-alpha-steroid 4-dehydrogenase 1 n=1 Tax=Blattamonas nauphoetae TaxID=2049346 RepID=A0ABQ9XJ05_9EUKA|nr:putative 3-oxo-5-alpha-steroid 4-dehydrogenase 1 [Blattamonas nauphoetae]